MKCFLLCVILFAPFPAVSQTSSPAGKAAPPTLRSILLEQLRTTHDKEDWFVPINIAVAGLTPTQAAWTDGKGNHSVGQLANHLLFWNTSALARFNGQKPVSPSNNDETFNAFDVASWAATTAKLDAIMTAWEKAVEGADEARLLANASLIAHISTHNAYHTGQMIYVRKLQGVWNPANGVK